MRKVSFEASTTKEWYDLFVDGKMIAYMYIAEDGGLIIHVYKDKVAQVSVS